MSGTALAQFFSGPFLVWFKIGFIVVIFLSALFFYSRRRSATDGCKSRFKILAFTALVFHVFYPLIETFGQYFIWREDSFSQLFLPPHQSLGYFFSYVWLHFWLNALIVIGIGVLFYLLLLAFNKYNQRFFEEGETELGFLCAFLVGWPQFVIFVVSVFVLVVVFSVFRRIFLKEIYTTLGPLFLIAAAIAFIWGMDLILLLNLGVLRI